MEITTPDIVKRAVSNVANLDLEQVASEATRVAKQARTSAMKVGRSTYRDARSLAKRHPQITAAIGGGLAVLGAVSLISWLRRD